MFVDQSIMDFLNGDDASVETVLNMLRSRISREIAKNRLSRDDSDDICNSVICELLQGLRKKPCTKKVNFYKRLIRSVDRNVQRVYSTRHSPYVHLLGNLDVAIPERKNRFAYHELVDIPEPALYSQKKTPKQEKQSQSDLLIVDDELVKYFTQHPDELYKIQPRKFEELVALILKDMGYNVELTGLGADGGVDIIASCKSGVGEILLIVDCKRYDPGNHVGVPVVRSLYGIGQQMRATMSLLATTSSFTKPAIEFRETVQHQLSLKDFDALMDWLKNYGQS